VTTLARLKRARPEGQSYDTFLTLLVDMWRNNSTEGISPSGPAGETGVTGSSQPCIKFIASPSREPAPGVIGHEAGPDIGRKMKLNVPKSAL
jgi:hypothetical protein